MAPENRYKNPYNSRSVKDEPYRINRAHFCSLFLLIFYYDTKKTKSA